MKSWVSKIFSLLLRLNICYRSRTPFYDSRIITFQLSRVILGPNSYLLFSVFIQANTTRELLQRGFNPLPPFSQSTVSDKYKELIVLKVTEGILCDEILRWASVWWTSTSPAILLQETKTEQGDLVESSESLPQLIAPLPGVRLIWSKYSPSYLIYEQRGVGQSAVVK